MQLKEVEAQARLFGMDVYVTEIRARKDFAKAIPHAHSHAQAAFVLSNPVTYQYRKRDRFSSQYLL
jgi:hypothetical protein